MNISGTTGQLEIAVVGGSSPATLVLIEELAKACIRGDFDCVSLRLYGRNRRRLAGIHEYSERVLRRHYHSDGHVQPLSIQCSTDLEEAIRSKSVIIVQVRPGDMRFRGAAEEMCLRHGIPGDEGIGPGGLACFLRSRPSLDRIASAIGEHAPEAIVLVLTSPLGLSVNRLESVSNNHCIGVCELPVTTEQRTIEYVATHSDIEIASSQVFGLNHQSWLTEFRDQDGADRTDEVLRVAGLASLVRLEAEDLEREEALPVHYLRLYYHQDREVRNQMKSGRTRGRQLSDWSARLHRALTRPNGIDVHAIEIALQERMIDWYREGVIPALAALVSKSSSDLPLNVRANGHLPGIDPRAIIEVNCSVSRNGISVGKRPVLPEQPTALLESLIRYEVSCQQIPDHYRADDLIPVLASHPLVADRETARCLAAEIVSEVGRDLALFGH